MIEPLLQPTPWTADLPLLCVGARRETPDVKTFTFRAPPGRWFSYRPGQFVTIELPTEEGTVQRSFTLSSSPSRPFSVAITAKTHEGSIGAQWMHQRLAAGMTLRATMPMGQFFLPDPVPGPLLLISAGSGATPLMSMLRWVCDCAPGLKVTWLHAARRMEDIIFRRELELMAAQMPALRLIFVTGQGAEGETAVSGRLDAQLLRRLVPDRLGRNVFCCGPEPFMAAMKSALEADGLDHERWHQESFGPGVLPVIDLSRVEEGATLRFTRSAVELPVIPGQTILQMAREAGLSIPSACGMGICGTCRIRASGTVEMHQQGGLFDDEIEEGYILACCSQPLGSVAVDL